MREQNRTRFSQYFEVFMDAPIDVLKTRDVKGVYATASTKDVQNIVGIDIPFEMAIETTLLHPSCDLLILSLKKGSNNKFCNSELMSYASLILVKKAERIMQPPRHISAIPP